MSHATIARTPWEELSASVVGRTFRWHRERLHRPVRVLDGDRPPGWGCYTAALGSLWRVAPLPFLVDPRHVEALKLLAVGHQDALLFPAATVYAPSWVGPWIGALRVVRPHDVSALVAAGADGRAALGDVFAAIGAAGYWAVYTGVRAGASAHPEAPPRSRRLRLIQRDLTAVTGVKLATGFQRVDVATNSYRLAVSHGAPAVCARPLAPVEGPPR